MSQWSINSEQMTEERFGRCAGNGRDGSWCHSRPAQCLVQAGSILVHVAFAKLIFHTVTSARGTLSAADTVLTGCV